MKNKFLDSVIEKLIFISGITAIIFVSLIFIFLFKESFLFLKKYNIFSFLFGKYWYPTSDPPKFGILPLILGSLLVTLGASIIAIPTSIIVAFYISEVAPSFLKDILKSFIELLAAIPSIVVGFIGMVTLVPLLRTIFDLPTGLTALSGSIMLAFMAMPTIISISEDAISAIPKEYKEGAIALGATKWQTMYRVLLPAAIPGILGATMLGVGRVIGETMAVMMITGNAAVIPTGFLNSVRTMTATIAAEMGETPKGSLHYHALFAIGLVLFLITFCIDFVADTLLNKMRR
jgi:phosphate transport system permease protein